MSNYYFENNISKAWVEGNQVCFVLDDGTSRRYEYPEEELEHGFESVCHLLTRMQHFEDHSTW